MWKPIVVDNAVVPARPTGLWTLVIGYLDGPITLRISAHAQQWSYADVATARCGADGDPTALLSAGRCLEPTAPVGALIGKIGGSTAGDKDGSMKFVVGSSCVINVPQDGGGPLYLTINDEPAGMENNAGEITVDISWLYSYDASAAPRLTSPLSPPTSPPVGT